MDDDYHLVTEDKFTTTGTTDDLNHILAEDGSCPDGQSYVERSLVLRTSADSGRISATGTTPVDLDACKSSCDGPGGCNSFDRCLFHGSTASSCYKCVVELFFFFVPPFLTRRYLFFLLLVLCASCRYTNVVAESSTRSTHWQSVLEGWRHCRTHYKPAGRDGCKSSSGQCRKCGESGFNCDATKTDAVNCQAWCSTFPGCTGVFLRDDGTCCPSELVVRLRVLDEKVAFFFLPAVR